MGLGGSLVTLPLIKPKMAQKRAPSQTVRAGWLNRYGFALGRMDGYLYKYLDERTGTHVRRVEQWKGRRRRYL